MSAEKNETIIVNALNVAAEQYDRDAKTCTCSTSPESCRRLAEQFERQAREARELAVKIEQSGLDQAACL